MLRLVFPVVPRQDHPIPSGEAQRQEIRANLFGSITHGDYIIKTIAKVGRHILRLLVADVNIDFLYSFDALGIYALRVGACAEYVESIPAKLRNRPSAI
jgi:hypothetical protein